MPIVLGLLLAAGFVVYVLFVYPLILGVLARLRPRPVRRAPFQPPVSIIVVVHNGARFIENKLRSILELQYPRDLMEIIVASDGSTDGTDALVEGFASSGVRLLPLPRGGKAAALNAAIPRATHEILVLTDVRQLLAPDSLAMLLENLADPEVGAASGELTILKGGGQEEAAVGLYWRYELWIRLRLSELDSIFGATGAYYAIRRSLTRQLPRDTLVDDMHLPLAAFFSGHRLIVDSRARMFDYPSGLASEFRRKVRTLAGVYQVIRAYPALLGPGNRMWFHFVSYKLARLLLPFALLAILVLSFGLPAPWSILALAAQAVFYAAALVDLWIPEGSLFSRITSPARTFVTLMAASLCAVSILFVPSSRLWRPTQLAPATPPTPGQASPRS
jgi:cellulose synthase/poly-beta-1,6-N-acetylglucosamine synthase-like glycosyltransferase